MKNINKNVQFISFENTERKNKKSLYRITYVCMNLLLFILIVFSSSISKAQDFAPRSS